MTIEYSGTGDPRRSMELIWGLQEGPRRGPKPRLTVPMITAAAIALADAEGLAALSMRKVADQLGVTAMSLYTYVPGKAELLDVMLDTVLGEVLEDEPVEGGWRVRLEAVARANWALYRRHPWLLHVATHRPVLGPNLIAKYDRELQALEGLGLTDIEMDLLLTTVLDYVHGAVRGVVHGEQQAQQRTGLSDEQWWETCAPLLTKVLQPERYPVATRVGSVTGEAYNGASDPERAFEFGLQRVLDGAAALIERRLGG